jgi:concentrative nucleoside transporter, CNT family
MIWDVLRGILGIGLILGIAYLFSNNRKAVPWPMVWKGLLIQAVFGTLVIKGDALRGLWFPLGWFKDAFEFASRIFVKLMGFTAQGSQFVFGNLAFGPGTPGSMGFFFVFQVLPTMIFFSAIMSMLYHLGIMQRVVQAIAWGVQKLLGTSGAETLSNTANIFIGQTEAPLLIRPYLKSMTKSEINTIMVGGFATIAGGVMAAYVQILGASYATAHGLSVQAGQIKFAAQLMGASIMAAPAGLLLSKILYPETERPVTSGNVRLPREKNASNVIEAVAIGAADGLQLVLNVAAMLLAFIAIIALGNYLLDLIGRIGGLNVWLQATFGKPLSLQLIFGSIFQFVAFGIGVPWAESFQFGSLLGTKLVLNEFVAYLDMSKMIEMHQLYSEKSVMMIAFALCGFANFSSIAIQIGGISPIAPQRRPDIAALGLRALLGGTLATLMTAAIAGILFEF